MDEEKAEQIGGSLGVGPAISGLSEPKDELTADAGRETARELAEGSAESPALLEAAGLESPLVGEPSAALEPAEAVACEAMEAQAINADSAKDDAKAAEASPAEVVTDASQAEAKEEAETPRAPGKFNQFSCGRGRLAADRPKRLAAISPLHH